MESIPTQKPQQLKITRKTVGVVGAIVVGLSLFFTGLYMVNPEEVGVIQRFGKYLKTTEPGLHFKLPFGVDELTKVKVKHVFKEEFGFRTISPGVNTRFSSKNFSKESLMLTGDLNIADVEWIVQYRVKDPRNFLFNIRSIRRTIQNLSESSMRLIVGDRSVDEVIVLNRREIAFACREFLQEKLDEYNAGIEVVTVNLQNVNPPESVKPAFNAVNSAKQEQEKIINNAWQQYNKIIPEAEGKALQTIEQAEGYAVNRTNRATGDASLFTQIFNEYKKAKSVTKTRMYLETMNEVLPKLNHIYLVDEDQKGVLPLLNLDKGGKK